MTTLTISNPFIIETSGLADVYEELAGLSKTFQTPDIYPWHVEEVNTNSTFNLRLMGESLKISALTIDDMLNISSPTGRPFVRKIHSAMDEIDMISTMSSSSMKHKIVRKYSAVPRQ